MEQQVNINIDEGSPFYSHEATVNFTPTQVSLDFKCITPRTDPRAQKPSFHLIHNVVMMDPWHAKALVDVMKNVIAKYEKEFGKIKKPPAVAKAEKKQKELADKGTVTEAPTYLG